MRSSPAETSSIQRDADRERRVVQAAEPDPEPRVPFSPANRPVSIARGILDDELATAGAIVSAR